jgi:MOSC domain-containing protein YiiM
MSERELGRIIRLQVQRDPLKVKGVSYDPSGILAIDEASLDAHGMIGRHADAWVVDAHHAAHPKTCAGGRRALSIGFAGHYEAMASRFGAARLGCAGENIIVDTPGRVTTDDLLGEVVVHAAEGDVILGDARVAAPCAEFTSWIKGLDMVIPKIDQPEDVAFLDNGTRGFILDVSRLDGPVFVRVGDRVSVRR